jgi:hypothetical protein
MSLLTCLLLACMTSRMQSPFLCRINRRLRMRWLMTKHSSRGWGGALDERLDLHLCLYCVCTWIILFTCWTGDFVMDFRHGYALGHVLCVTYVIYMWYMWFMWDICDLCVIYVWSYVRYWWYMWCMPYLCEWNEETKKGTRHTLCRVPHTAKHTWEQALLCVSAKAHGKGSAQYHLEIGFAVCHAGTHRKVTYFAVCPVWDTQQSLETLPCALHGTHSKSWRLCRVPYIRHTTK